MTIAIAIAIALCAVVILMPLAIVAVVTVAIRDLNEQREWESFWSSVEDGGENHEPAKLDQSLQKERHAEILLRREL